MCKTYNGWTNYETWCVNLWLTDDPYLQEEIVGIVNQNQSGHIYPTADSLKDFVSEMNPLLDDASMWSDLLTAALGSVDWFELAEHYLEDLIDNID